MRWFIFLLGFVTTLSASSGKKPIYNPWYTGSLIASSARCVPPNVMVLQPYVYVTSRYGIYNDHFHFESRRNTEVLRTFLLIQGGFNKYLDFQVTVTTQSKFHQSHNQTKFGDTSILIGLQVLRESDSFPWIRLGYNQSFPTGSYENLNPRKHGVDLSGSGTFRSDFAIFIQKSFKWFPSHPIRMRWNFGISVHSSVCVNGFNAYGGGEDAKENLNPGVGFKWVFAPEFSLTQNWVLTFDLLYTLKLKGSMSGFPGIDSTGQKGHIAIERVDELSIAPAVEYNFSDDFGIIAGVQASLIGRNLPAHISGVISTVYSY